MIRYLYSGYSHFVHKVAQTEVPYPVFAGFTAIMFPFTGIVCLINKVIERIPRFKPCALPKCEYGWKFSVFVASRCREKLGCSPSKILAKNISEISNNITYGQSGTALQVRRAIEGIEERQKVVHVQLMDRMESQLVSSTDNALYEKKVLGQGRLQDHKIIKYEILKGLIKEFKTILTEAEKNKNKVHVSCYQGKGRAGMFLVAYLIQERKTKLAKALQIVMNAREDQETLLKEERLAELIYFSVNVDKDIELDTALTELLQKGLITEPEQAAQLKRRVEQKMSHKPQS